MMKVLRSGINPNKKLSQHFLIQPSIAKRIVDYLEIQTCDKILEIGSGEGILTEFLLESRAEKIIGVEVDSRLIYWLKERFYGNRRFQLIDGDFLKFDLSKIASEKKRVRIVGNLPYRITSSIFFHILSFREKIQDITVMVQKEVGERIMSERGSKKYGIPSVIFQYFYEIRKLFSVHRNSFFPAPKIDSMVIQLQFRDKVLYEVKDLNYFFRIVKTSFGQRRKMLKNSLKSLIEDEWISQDMNYFQKRPEDLSINEFVDLSNQLYYLNERGKRG